MKILRNTVHDIIDMCVVIRDCIQLHVDIVVSLVVITQVDSAAKLEKIYGSVKLCHDDDDDGSWPSDFNCILVEVYDIDLFFIYIYSILLTRHWLSDLM